MCLLSFLYAKTTLRLPSQDSVFGKALVAVEDIQPVLRYGAAYWKYRLRLIQFVDMQNTVQAANIPCTAIWKEGTRPKADFLYEVEGVLKKNTHTFSLYGKESSWRSVTPVSSLVEWRIETKRRAKQFLCAHLPAGQSRDFLIAALMGGLGDEVLAKQLQQFGVQHIVAISGFHYSLIIGLFSFLLRFFIEGKKLVFVLICIACTYLAFVGFSASISRACVVAIIAIAAHAAHTHSSGLNSLGIALCVVLAIDPFLCCSMAFQLSFLATGALLLVYPPIKIALIHFLYNRKIEEVFQWRWIDQLGYLFLSCFRSSFSLVLAVTLLTAPLCLYVTHLFALLGLIYNMFFPFLIGLALALLLLALCTSFLPPVSALLFALCHSVAECALVPITAAPFLQNTWMLRMSLPEWVLVVWLSSVIFISMSLKEQIDSMFDKKINFYEFNYIK